MNANAETLWEKRVLEDVSSMQLIMAIQEMLTELSFRTLEPLQLRAVEDESVVDPKKRGHRRPFLRNDGLKPPNAHSAWTPEQISIIHVCKRAGWSNKRIAELKSIGKSPRAVKAALNRHPDPENG